ncbi:GTP cyclohydrolase I [Gonapodya prolifera JEL478]|uniref:GTP cyclohydrolase 1 n=1 Tax=Gonapodya prolifera (strain JEL478) TaxID=1344416 RepID=A0A139AG57_GONPJ|nr:GTP cyclohydrolase I [Gonapodya prolifera JEL478]|eukprot:KXS15791.1 GTP cyclohydrolase I [Gonapodya prolifera JEL478]
MNGHATGEPLSQKERQELEEIVREARSSEEDGGEYDEDKSNVLDEGDEVSHAGQSRVHGASTTAADGYEINVQPLHRLSPPRSRVATATGARSPDRHVNGAGPPSSAAINHSSPTANGIHVHGIITNPRVAAVAQEENGSKSGSFGFSSTRSLSPMPDPDGLSWPSIGTRARKDESPEERQKRVEKLTAAVRTMLECIGEDPDREGLLKTPERYAKALLFLTKGYEENILDVVNGAVFKEDHDEMVIVKGIDVFSLCEHHCVPFTGKISIGYLPSSRVLGLSKVARIAEMFARRLQLQERLTKQVAVALEQILKPRGVAVVMEASHLCMVMRGVQKPGSKTVTSCMLGGFRTDHRTREEFLR